MLKSDLIVDNVKLDFETGTGVWIIGTHQSKGVNRSNLRQYVLRKNGGIDPPDQKGPICTAKFNDIQAATG